jgi:2-aminobenzoylacetyl-CoA thioesterase
MLINKPGKITEGLYLLGEGITLIYIVKGKDAMIIGGGMNWIAPQLEKQLFSLDIDLADIKYLVIPHAHFDHCGAVPYLRRKLPWIKVLGSESARKILSKQKVLDYMELANLMMIEHYGLKEQYEKMNLKIDAINIDQVVGDSTVVDLGNGLDVHFIEAPGHSPCALAVYIPKLKAIFPTDAAPVPQGGVDKLTRPSPQYDFGLYKRSLRKLLDYEIDICAFDHFAAVTGAEARQVLVNGLKLCEEYGTHVTDMYKESGDFEGTARIVAHEATENFDFGGEDLIMPVARAEVRNILKDAGISVV